MADNAYITALRWSLSRYQAELLELRTLLGQRAQGEIVNILLKIKNSFLPTKQILIGL